MACGKYNDKRRETTIRYIKESQHEIKLRYKKTDYESVIKPAIAASGMPTATFIKKAISEKIEREHLLEDYLGDCD